MSVSFSALKIELQTDPKALGYAPLITVANWIGVAALLNQPGASRETLPRLAVPSAAALCYLDERDMANFTVSQLAFIQAIAASGTLLLKDPLSLTTPPADSVMFTRLKALFPGTTPTGANILALDAYPCSRAESLFGEGVQVTADQCRSAWGG